MIIIVRFFLILIPQGLTDQIINDLMMHMVILIILFICMMVMMVIMEEQFTGNDMGYLMGYIREIHIEYDHQVNGQNKYR